MKVEVAGKGPALVCCHGFTTTSGFWREQVAEFSRTHTLYLVNLPGHGISPRPRNRQYSIAAFAQDIEALFRHREIDIATLVGLSMGGTIAQRFALAHPELLSGLVLVGATPHGLGEHVRIDNVLGAIEQYGVGKASQNVIEHSFASGAPRDLVEFAKQEVLQTPDFVAREAIVSLNEADSREELGRIAVPTLVVCGDEDRITPLSESEKLANGIPHAELAVIRGAGHFPMLEKPQEFNSTLRQFLDRLAS
jgi:pimeloyl-ACP methyl ester carboxylesterase